MSQQKCLLKIQLHTTLFKYHVIHKYTNIEIFIFPNPYSDFIKQPFLNFTPVSWTSVETQTPLIPLQRKLPSKLLETILFGVMKFTIAHIYHCEVIFPEVDVKFLFKFLSPIYQVTYINTPQKDWFRPMYLQQTMHCYSKESNWECAPCTRRVSEGSNIRWLSFLRNNFLGKSFILYPGHMG